MRKHLRGAGVLAAAVVAALALAAPAAQAATPAPGYTQFTGCPSPSENPKTAICVYSKIKSGSFKMGNKEVPITNPITMTGGVDANFENFSANAQGGLKPVKQKVPGGVVGLTGLTWLLEFLGSEALTLYAVTEAVGVPKPFTPEEIGLPIRIHLINGVLGNNCYVGSVSNPINLRLITGTTSPPPPNKPISGKEGTLSELPNGNLLLANATYVDNSFSAPGANGCVLTLFGFIPISINGLVNSASGLPAAAGTNETVQNIDTELAAVENVYP